MVHIEDDTGDFYVDTPIYKGEVYFSNPPQPPAQYPPSQPTQRPQQNRAPQSMTPQSMAPQSMAPQSIAPQSIAPQKKKRKATGRAAVVSLLYGILLVAVSAMLSLWAISCINDILAIDRERVPEVVQVPENADTNQIVDILHNVGLIKHPNFCKIFFRVTFSLKNTKNAPVYNSGTYYVEANLGLEGMLNRFRYVKAAPKTVSLVFPEGYSSYQIIEKLADADVCAASHLYAALAKSEQNFTNNFVKKLENSPERTQLLEGYLFPARYEFYVNEDANSVIKRFLSAFEKRWTPEYQKRADELGMTMDEIITLASIIQREAANGGQMKGISAVLHNRLNKRAQFPALECNATADYVKNNVTKALGEAEANRYLTAYNSYLTEGLPPGPICNPGIDAIEAALYPDTKNYAGYFFFQHDKFGTIYWAKTDAEHYRNSSIVLARNQQAG